MTGQNRCTLTFHDASLERLFVSHTHARTLQQGRVAIIVGVIVYLLFGVLDQWVVPAGQRGHVWAIRCAALTVPVTVFALMYTRWFERASHLLLALIGLAAGVGLLGMFVLMPLDGVLLYYPGLVLAAFFTYTFVGTRFVYALCVDILLLIGYNLIFAAWLGYPLPMLVSHDFFIVSANLIGGVAGYLQESQRRELFLRERELEQERQVHLTRSLHDRLTGLPNRDLLHDRITQALLRSQRDGSIHAGFFIDLDGFKRINDALGHASGDLTLNEIAARLSSVMRDSDTVARLGGDEFFVLAYGVCGLDVEGAINQAERMLALIHTPVRGLPEGFVVSASIGICQFPYAGATVEDIIRRADHAMYQAKMAGKNRYAIADVVWARHANRGAA
jgi:diguanylate cyclase (GGDEF)-like protein